VSSPGRTIGGNVWQIDDLVEKPRAEDAPSDLAIIGRYVLTPGPVRDPREDGGRQAWRDPADRRPADAAQSAGRCTRWNSSASATDTGDKLGFLKATVEFASPAGPVGTPSAPI